MPHTCVMTIWLDEASGRLCAAEHSWIRNSLPQATSWRWDALIDDCRVQVVAELTSLLTEQLQRELDVWIGSVLQPLVIRELRTIRQAGDGHRELSLEGEPETGSAQPAGNDTDSLVQEMLVRSANALVEYERRVWHPSLLTVRLLQMASVQAALQPGVEQEQLREVVGWAYRRELMATLQQRAATIVDIVDEQFCQVWE